jgi:hypothetical protein
MKSEVAENFLYKWRAVHIYAAHKTLDELGDVLEQLTADAASVSLSLDDLDAGAGGNVVEYVRQALAKREIGGPTGG